MSFITQNDFETKAGQEKIIKAIHSLDYKVRELDQKVNDLAQRERSLERDISGHSSSKA